jgi:hypothetical protein
MTRKRTSPIWTKNKSEMQTLLNDSSSFVEVLKKLGLDAYSGNHRTLNHRIKEDSLDISQLEKKRQERIKQSSIKNKIPLLEIMVENSSYCNSKGLKMRLVKDKILEYACKKCGNKGTWMEEKLILQIEHKNGNNKDNRVENLCFLCPNCHSQTKTFAGRNSGMKKNRVCINCKGLTKGKGKICLTCVYKNQPKKFLVTKQELETLIKKYPFTTIGKKFGVSDNAVRKRCKSMGIDVPKRKKNTGLK